MQMLFDELISNTSLVTSASLSDELVVGSDSAIFVGIGISTTKSSSAAVPFDILMLLLLSEKVRRILNWNRCIILVADTTARHNQFMSESLMESVAGRVVTLLQRAVSSLGLENVFKIVRISSFHCDSSFQQILDETYRGIGIRENWTKAVHGYAAEQLAIVEFMRRHWSVRLKISWIVDEKTPSTGYDERFFDALYRDVYSSQLSFVYTAPGRTFDPSSARVCPYIATSEQRRILVRENEPVEQKLAVYFREGSKTYMHAVQHLDKIVCLYEELFGSLPQRDLAFRVRYLIENLFMSR